MNPQLRVSGRFPCLAIAAGVLLLCGCSAGGYQGPAAETWARASSAARMAEKHLDAGSHAAAADILLALWAEAAVPHPPEGVYGTYFIAGGMKQLLAQAPEQRDRIEPLLPPLTQRVRTGAATRNEIAAWFHLMRALEDHRPLIAFVQESRAARPELLEPIRRDRLFSDDARHALRTAGRSDLAEAVRRPAGARFVDGLGDGVGGAIALVIGPILGPMIAPR